MAKRCGQVYGPFNLVADIKYYGHFNCILVLFC